MIATVLGLSPVLAVACVVIVFVGAAVQGSLGIGLGMISSPVLAIADTDFIPTAIVLAVIPLSGAVAWAERTSIDRRGLALTLIGRVPGVIAGAAVAALLSDEVLAVLVAGSVIVAVAVSIVGKKFVAGDVALAAAGLTSGFMTTTTGVGGPPMALTYQHSDPAVMRGTVSAFFTVGAVMSLAALAVAGEFGRRQLELAAFLLPSIFLGIAVAHLVRDRLDASIVRPAVLVVCTTSALVLLVKTF